MKGGTGVRGCGFPLTPPPPCGGVEMAAIRSFAEGKIRGGEWRPLLTGEERQRVVVEEERKVVSGVSMEEIWRDYEAAKTLLAIAEAVGDEERVRKQRERVEMLESELRDAVLCEDYEDFGGWC